MWVKVHFKNPEHNHNNGRKYKGSTLKLNRGNFTDVEWAHIMATEDSKYEYRNMIDAILKGLRENGFVNVNHESALDYRVL